MLKRLLLAVLFAFFAHSAAATDYTDMWYLPAESGWGVNFTQNANTLFITFFLYDASGQPTWYVAITSLDANGNYSGTLYSTTGTYFGAPWTGVTATAAGTATFTPVNAYQGTLSYTLINGPTVNKSIVRQSLVAIDLTGNYSGGQGGVYTQCTDPSLDYAYEDTFHLQVSQSAGNVTMTFAYNSLGESCTLSGALVQTGQILTVPSATYTCEDGLNTAAALTEIKRTSLGIEGRFASLNIGGNCREDAAFSGVSLD